MIFSGAVLSLYRMGSRMYLSGSWKYTRQKEAERFFQMLKERVEQASCLITVNIGNKDKPSVREQTNFIISNDTVELSTEDRANERQYLAQFAVCKPCIKFPNGGIMTQGLVICHGLVLIPDEETGLYRLVLRAEKTKDNAEFFNPSGDSCIPPSAISSDFEGDAKEYGLLPLPVSYTLNDVFSVKININSGENESETSSVDTSTSESDDSGESSKIIPKIFSITVGMRNAKHSQTQLEMTCKARLEGSVGLSER